MFLEKLRKATGPSHKALEEIELSKNLVTNLLTREAYILYLKRLYGVVAPCEQHVYPVLKDIVSDIEERKKSALITLDLQKLGITNEPELLSKDDLLSLTQNIDTAMGCLYVLEGSTLGGNIIFKNVQQTLHIDSDTGAAYFSVYGANVGKMWKSFLDMFTSYAVTTGNEEEIINGAVRTFGEIEKWMRSN